jgi:molybdenum cofactor cytidylyltransferase
LEIGVGSRECVTVVGAGGKTSLCWLLLRDFAARGERAIFTTTTRIRRPQATAFDVITLSEAPALPPGDWRTACIASAVDGLPDDRPLAESLMPVVYTKLAGFSADQFQAFYPSISNLPSPISLIVEADGARGLMLKAPAAYEPAIPACATSVCVVANLAALGRPLDERTAHRPERIARLTGTNLGALISAQILVDVLLHPEGGLKGIPAQARRIAVLMQRDEPAAQADVAFILNELAARGYDHAFVISPRAAVVYPR